jgi:hypothetical protein
MVDKTPNLELNYIYSNQAQKEISVNEAFTTLDAVWNNGAISKAIATPPSSPLLGDLYIVAASPSGAWLGKGKNLAYYNNGWKFITPKEGITIWINDEDAKYLINVNRPRLILKKNPSLGVDTDVVFTTATVAANGVWEVYVDCDGTLGWCNFDYWSVS